VNTTQLAAESGATFRMLDYWVRQGYLHPIGGVGTGSVRDFPAGEVHVAKVMARLVSAGVSPEAAHRAARGNGELAPGVRVEVDLAVTV
jgi:DNA-binding transcriptional MerR regulator